ncbi:transglycosylase domain-containing protein [Flammeovirga sp. EKP202]|uniref:transglycosylase domain-containing protein n=1 Tax=Flammeovirga sp. EKP202 TaxID=2770592 RepID=UPI00165F6E44|nr:transglycosylase domain-containing protein [Flammeovirga sp. EKP202]MBD0400480.1 transglycosylase domain-containing protein [Flammeovirga sp. EKP202]
MSTTNNKQKWVATINQNFHALYFYILKNKKPIFLSIIGLGLMGVSFILLFLSGTFGTGYSDEELLSYENEEASTVYSEDQILIGKFFAENRTNVQFEDLPKHLINALVATEDARYFEHEGVDSRSVLRVLFKSIILGDKSSGGGSTITQQLAKNMYGRKDYGPFSMLFNKSNEIKIAQQIERLYSKEDILRMYLNTVPFGEDLFGIEAASERFFNKKVSDLKVEESAVLIGILKANTFYNPRLYPENAQKRRNVVMNQMVKYDLLSKIEYDSLKVLPLKLDYANIENEGISNYFLVHVKKKAKEIVEEYNKANSTDFDLEKDGLIIQTSLNAKLQYNALLAFQEHLSTMQKLLDKQYANGASKKQLERLVTSATQKFEQPKAKKSREYFTWEGIKVENLSVEDSIRKELSLLHAGFLAVNPNDGFIKAWVGGIDFRTHPYDQIMAKRQLASTFKPILYAAAMEKGMPPCKYLKNEIEEEDGWKPENYSKTSGGMYTLSASLVKSLNIPTVNLYQSIRFDRLEELWVKLGFSEELKDYPSTSLGTVDASIYELAIAYAAFANGGYKIQPRWIKSITTTDGKKIYEANHVESERVLSEETSILMSTILQKAINEGTGVALRSKYKVRLPIGGKTGTSQNYGDAWFASINPNLVMVTRVGASSNQIHFNSGVNGSGSKLALPITGLTLQETQKDKKLSKELFTYFPALPDYLSDAFDCEDFKEGTDVEMFFNKIFKKKTTEEKENRKAERKKRREERKKKRKAE